LHHRDEGKVGVSMVQADNTEIIVDHQPLGARPDNRRILLA